MKKNAELIFRTPRFDIMHRKYDAQGKSKDFYYVKKPNAISVIIINKSNIGLLKVKRPILNKSGFEIVGGRIEGRESPLNAAKRELLEETNLKTKNWRPLSITMPLPSVTTEKVYVYLAMIGDLSTLSLSSDEGIKELTFFEEAKVLDLIKQNKIKCSVDTFSLLYYLMFKNNYNEEN